MAAVGPKKHLQAKNLRGPAQQEGAPDPRPPGSRAHSEGSAFRRTRMGFSKSSCPLKRRSFLPPLIFHKALRLLLRVGRDIDNCLLVLK